MSTSVLRTVDAWWVRTPMGAAKIDTTATTTAVIAERATVFVPIVRVGGSARLAAVTTPVWVTSQVLAALAKKPFPFD